MKIAEYINYRIQRAAILLVLFFVSCTAATVQANVVINPTSLSFGNQSIGTTSTPIKMTLTNAREHSTTNVRMSSSVPQSSFSWASSPFSMRATHQISWTITFKQAAPQPYKVTLTFTLA